MNNSTLYLFTLIILFPIIGCQNTQREAKKIDYNSYISKFEFTQQNPSNENTIRITSEKAIVDPVKNDIYIFDSSIDILNKNGTDIKVISGNSTLDNNKNLIRVYNNVNISLLELNNYYMNTESFSWDLNTSKINFDTPLNINFNDSLITSKNGNYNINKSTLSLNKNILNRRIYNYDSNVEYQVKVISDFAKWVKLDNSLEFSSNKNQVETTINFLRFK
tara:strand:+ start:797 stop:1456 length:660 start_codon:yes stop_codon:yes gene_type:complete